MNTKNGEAGFTLIELLVVVAIIGILANTAISQYARVKERSFNARAVSDLRNIISSQEAQFVDSELFISDITQLTGFDVTSPAVSVVLNADASSWQGSSYHPDGTKTFCFDSGNADGIVEVQGVNQPCP